MTAAEIKTITFLFHSQVFPMEMFDINIYQSRKLGGYSDREHYEKWRPAENVENCLESVADNLGSISVNVDVIRDDIAAPTEDLDEGFWTSSHYSQPDHPCGDGYEYYDNLEDWWMEWVDCHSTATDSNLLLTNGSRALFRRLNSCV